MKILTLTWNRILLISFLFLVSVITSCNRNIKDNKSLPRGYHGFIGVSKVNPSYFSFSDGTPYVPVGINLINPSWKSHGKPDSSMIEIGKWMKNLSDNGGNYIRVWLSESFWDMEDAKAGEYNPEKIERIDKFISLARKYKLHIKITLEHFRSITLEENNQSWATKFVYHTSKGGPLDSVRQYLATEAGYKLFLDKADFYKKHFGADTLFFGWELWNEMNAMHGPQDSIFFDWNKKMLKEIKSRLPENLVMQSFGSFDNEETRSSYRKLMLLPGNEVAQIHRYLDPGAPMEVCHAPMDIICSSAVEEIRSYNTGKPVLLAETGAVESGHAGPSRLYALDTAGILLHDILFAPFFSGSAGTGMSWHWDAYVDRNNLWYHFSRFSEAIKDINPLEENFVPSKWQKNNLRAYQLNGKRTTLVWLRDTSDNWRSELVEGRKPGMNKAVAIDLRDASVKQAGKISIYDPWKNKWTETTADDLRFILPDFQRSIVVRITN
jgi:hypothetical protein